jgi:LPS O-antigen subunit length determinant protein (WzzB/FepE family)
MNEYEDEVNLIDYLNIIWKRKWLIIIPTFFCAIIAGVYSFLLPPVWEVDAIIQPGKYIIQTEGNIYTEGVYKEIVIADPNQIARQINEGSYTNIIVAELNLDIREFPKLKAENLKNTNLVKISARENDMEKAKLILLSLFNHLKRELDKKVDIEVKGIDSQIKSKEIEKIKTEEEIKTNKNKLDIIKQRKKEIEKELNDIRKRIEALEKEQRLSLKKENRSDSESLAMLLYSNEIQQSLEYHNTLNELLSRKKIEEEDINLEIKYKDETIKQLENEVGNLNKRKGRIDYTQLIKEPTSSLNPVSPKKKLNVMIAGIIGLMIFTMLAFFLEYLEKHMAKSKC